jgi:hypothetical protein
MRFLLLSWSLATAVCCADESMSWRADKMHERKSPVLWVQIDEERVYWSNDDFQLWSAPKKGGPASVVVSHFIDPVFRIDGSNL